MNNKTKILFGILIVSLLVLVGCSSKKYDNFAKCLTEKGAKFYGAYWCPHCTNQKAMFGDSIEDVNYIECSLPNRAGQTDICIQEKIQSYPTWEFSDGTRVTGVRSLEQLSSATGCVLEE